MRMGRSAQNHAKPVPARKHTGRPASAGLTRHHPASPGGSAWTAEAMTDVAGLFARIDMALAHLEQGLPL